MNQQNRTIKERVLLRTKLSSKEVFVRGDFANIADYDQVGRALLQLVKSGELVKFGQGLYAPARTNSITGKPTIAVKGGLKRAVLLAFQRLNVQYAVALATKNYNERKSTQIPARLEFEVQRGFSRKFELNNTTVRLIPTSRAQLSA